MEEFKYRTLVSSFSEFLKKQEKLLKSLQVQSLISYIFPAEQIELYTRINNFRKKQEIMYYSEKPLLNQFFLGINSILTITEKGERRFSSLEKRIKETGENLVSNRRDYPELSVPLFFGGMKFTVEHSDDYWKDFDDSIWFIPELLYLRSDNKYYFMFNFFATAKVKTETLLSKFENVLKLFYTETEPWDGKNLRVLKKTGVEPKDKKKWKNQVQQVLEKIGDGELKKIVLSRKIELIFTSDISIEPILKSLADNYPECTLFLFHIGKSTFVGASPETLARANGSQIVLETLAGSAERGSDDASDNQIEKQLLASKKNLYEHEIVVDYLRECLPGSSEDMEIGKPTVKKLKNIQHLKTLIKLNLNEHNSFINIIGKIHPTPAVCGLPSDTALNIIKKTENHQRGLYAGLIGWLNFQNEGELVLAIRSALAVGNKLIVYAGCGIVNGSNPDDEYEETELKLKPFLSIFNNEN
jgi:menaquinone-specific isochorismate synthase